MLALFSVITVFLAVSFVSIVYAQEPETEFTEGKTMLYIAGAWLIYSILGMIPALVAGNPFDARKFTRSFLWAVIVAFLAIGFNIHPTQVETEYTNLVTSIVNLIGNSGFGLSLIYFFDKLYRIIVGLSTQLKATGTAPPK